MNTKRIDGKAIARRIIEELKKKPRPEKDVAAVLVGDNPASVSFLKQKEKIAKELGIDFALHHMSEASSEAEVITKITELNHEQSIGGIIIQLPLPAHLNRAKVLAALSKEKDVDGLIGGTTPPAVGTVKTILEEVGYELADKIVAVVGRGFLVGAPIAEWLQGKAKELIVLDSKSDLAELKRADLVITGVGKPGLITPSMLKEGAGIIDFGYGMDSSGKLSGDFNPTPPITNYQLPFSFYTPTPGGTGPILVGELFRNFHLISR